MALQLMFRRVAFLLMVLSPGLLVRGGATEPPGLWLDVPYVHQEKDGCGSASLAMLLRYWSQKNAPVPAERTDPAQIQRALYSRKARGIYASDMGWYLKESGFDVFTFRGEWSDLRSNLSKGRPVIVSLKRHGAAIHYVVISGIDTECEAVLVNDPARGKLLRQDRADFEKEWRATGSWTLLAVPKQRE